MADGPQNKGDPDRAHDAPGLTPQESAEAKRLEARRRFLRGGISGVTVLVTAKKVHAAGLSPSACALLLLNQGHLVQDDLSNLASDLRIAFGSMVPDCDDENDIIDSILENLPGNDDND